MIIEIISTHKRAYPKQPWRTPKVLTEGDVLEVGKDISKEMADRCIECDFALEVDGEKDFADMLAPELRKECKKAGIEYTEKDEAIAALTAKAAE